MLIWEDREFRYASDDLQRIVEGSSGERVEFSVDERLTTKANIIGTDEYGYAIYGEPVQKTECVLREYDEKYDRMEYVDRYSCLSAAKLEAERRFKEREKKQTPKSKIPFTALGAGKDSEFYPTPELLAGRMFAMLDMRNVQSVLEPSAGNGDLISSFKRFAQKKHDRYYRCSEDMDIDAIELNPELAACCKGKGIRVVSDDFLRFHTEKRYDAIIMNPPFSNGDQHLLKALNLIERGGQVVSLLNAETLRNPYTNSRKLLMQKLAEYDATIIYVKDAFKKAARRTDVDVAIVYVSIPYAERQSTLFERLKRAREAQRESFEQQGLIVAPQDWIDTMVADYELDATAGIKIIDEFNAVAAHFDLLELSIGGKNGGTTNDFLRLLRGQYWRKLMDREEMTSLMTSAMQQEYQGKISELKDYDFSRYNIEAMLREVSAQLAEGVKSSIMNLFDTLTAKHAWLPETENNIHYYNGWATNKAHKVGKKVIIPMNGAFASPWSRETLNTYRITEVIRDLERALNFLDRGETQYKDPNFVQLGNANAMGKTKKVGFTYFDCDFFKKGTCHIKFHDDAQRIIDRLNIFAGREKAWLPPCYGKKAYQDMTAEEKAVIDDFQGADAYNQVMSDPGLYLTDSSDLALLPENI